LKSLLLLASGMAIGWLLHLFWSQEVTVSEDRMQPAIVSGYQNDQTDDAETQFSSSKIEQEHAITDSGTHVVGQRFSIEDCLKEPDQRTACKQHLLEWVKGNDSAAEAISKLQLWLGEYPDDLEVGLLLVDVMVKDRRVLVAVEQLQKIKSYQFDVEAVEVLVRKVESLIRSTDRMFHDNNELDGLISLYQILIEAQPSNPRWRFELSTVLQKTEKYDRALDMLSYILYDAEYGEKATAIYQKISSRDASAAQSNIPLIKSGSQFLVNAKINNAIPLKLLIDTGASITSIDRNILAKIPSTFGSQVKGELRTVNGTITTTFVKLDALAVGDVSVQNIETAGIDSLGEDIDGLLGMDFLSRFKFSIDQESRVLYLGDKDAR